MLTSRAYDSDQGPTPTTTTTTTTTTTIEMLTSRAYDSDQWPTPTTTTITTTTTHSHITRFIDLGRTKIEKDSRANKGQFKDWLDGVHGCLKRRERGNKALSVFV